MRPIIIGAGRGKRLECITDDQPKSFTPIGNKKILEWIFEAFSGAGLEQPVFIGGYLIDMVQRDFPNLTFCHNKEWERNNILVSLMYAEEFMDEGFVCSYSDILFRDTVVKRALNHSGDIVLCVDTHWQERYIDRTMHPADDAEKVTVSGDRITRIHRSIPTEDAAGEYIGVAKFSARGAELLRRSYHNARESFSGKPWREAETFEKAYHIQLMQDMIENGALVHMVTTEGDYMEIDTTEDYLLANKSWVKKFDPSHNDDGPLYECT